MVSLTATCKICSHVDSIEVEEPRWMAVHNGQLVPNVFPHLNAQQREIIMNNDQVIIGIGNFYMCSSCWSEIPEE
jgi:formamidopyrimidine-DNA glycosylase